MKCAVMRAKLIDSCLSVYRLYLFARDAFPRYFLYIITVSKMSLRFCKNDRRALSEFIPWRFVRCVITGEFFAGLLISFYVALFMTHSGMCLAQSFAEAAPKLMHLSENQAISVANKEPIGSFRISSPFGWGIDPMTGQCAQHQGVDIARKRGSPILAPPKGQVCLATYQANLGNLLEIDHGNGFVSRYGHLDRFAVKRRGLGA